MNHRRPSPRLAPFAVAALAFAGASASRAAFADDLQVAAATPTASTPSSSSSSGPSNADLDQRIRILERQLEIQKEEADAKAKDAYTTKFDQTGLNIQNAKGDWQFKFRGLLQVDERFFFDDFDPTHAPVTSGAQRDTLRPTNDTVLLRRVEPTFELTLSKYVFLRIQPQFAGDTLATSDVYGEFRLNPAFVIRAGKFKGPVDLENLRQTGAITFIERGLPNELAPNRDLGIMLTGDLFQTTFPVNYSLGYFNGTPDGRDANGTSDPDNKKEIGARLFAEPFKNTPGVLQGLGFGVGGTTGPKESNATSTANDFLPRYRTPGQSVFFQYAAATAAAGATPATAQTLADGRFTRIEPQAYWYWNSLGVMAQYIVSKQDVVRGTNEEKLEHSAWQITTAYFLTGEDDSYKYPTKINNPFQIGGPGWGAFQVTARYGELNIDNDTFKDFIEANGANNRFANPLTNPTKAKSWTAAVNWFPVINLKLEANYEQTSFDGGSLTGGDRKTEKAFFTRFQIYF